MRTPRRHRESRLGLEALGSEFLNRREHRQSMRTAAVDAANQALVNERSDPIDNLDIAERPDPQSHLLDRRQRRAGEHREDAEDVPLLSIEELVAPLDRATERLVADGQVASSTAGD